jgi:hypothetical protein
MEEPLALVEVNPDGVALGSLDSELTTQPLCKT